ncbi:cytoplasmic tRNA 2-thiolation protein 2 [Clonorchis sinensis]|uniref:Cytoplasmic tRNA 2-thiolation protein 2 n=1 Tax=Clonorchis sinensis TaxID=79923 RepID=G7YJ79_CLOSI|nr:cytoplasmic tRNA 2-thiolation protein 2 [Clonorchis sinensis]
MEGKGLSLKALPRPSSSPTPKLQTSAVVDPNAPYNRYTFKVADPHLHTALQLSRNYPLLYIGLTISMSISSSNSDPSAAEMHIPSPIVSSLTTFMGPCRNQKPVSATVNNFFTQPLGRVEFNLLNLLFGFNLPGSPLHFRLTSFTSPISSTVFLAVCIGTIFPSKLSFLPDFFTTGTPFRSMAAGVIIEIGVPHTDCPSHFGFHNRGDFSQELQMFLYELTNVIPFFWPAPCTHEVYGYVFENAITEHATYNPVLLDKLAPQEMPRKFADIIRSLHSHTYGHMCSTSDDCSCSVARNKVALQGHRKKQCAKCKGSNGPPVLVIRSDDPALCRLVAGIVISVIRRHLLTAVVLRFQHPKRRFTPKLFHLIEPHSSSEECDAIAAAVQDSGFEYHLLNPIKVGPVQFSNIVLGSFGPRNIPELDIWIRQLLFVTCAKQLGCDFLCLGDTGTRLATSFLVSVIEGRGDQVCGGTVDKRYQDVTIIRPLYEFQTKELVFYARFCRLEPLISYNVVTDAVLERPGVTSLPRLCEDFLLHLQFGGFPSTTQTVLRNFDFSDMGTYVPYIRTENPHKLALASMEYSRSASNFKSDQTLPHSNEVKFEEDGQSNTNVDGQLCPSCSMLYAELKKPDEIRTRTFRIMVTDDHKLVVNAGD